MSRIAALTTLFANVLWDAFCLAMMFCGYDDWVPHWNLWEEEEDRLNPAAKVLFVVLVSLNGVLRFCVLFEYPSTPARWWPAVVTYAVEGCLLVGCGIEGFMRPRRAIAAGVLSWACMFVLLWALLPTK